MGLLLTFCGVGQERRTARETTPDAFETTDGYLSLPDGPGLGVEIDEGRVRELDGTDLGVGRSSDYRADRSVGER